MSQETNMDEKTITPETEAPVVMPELERYFRITRQAFAQGATEQDRRQALEACVGIQAMVHAEMEHDAFDMLLERLMPFAPEGPTRPFSVPLVPMKK
jgi:hypothetical protein